MSAYDRMLADFDEDDSERLSAPRSTVNQHLVECNRIAMFWRMYNGGRRAPHPVITEYTPEPERGEHAARFLLDGEPQAVTWRYEGGGDRAYWDDGWWPTFYLVTSERYGFVPWKRERRVPA